MDHNIIENVSHLKNDDFYNFVNGLVGQQLVDNLCFQSITSTQSLIRNPNVFEIFNMNCSEPDFLTIRERSCFQLDNGKYIVKVGLLNNLNYLLDFLKQQQQNLNVKNDSIEKYPGLSYEFINKHPLLKTLIDWYLLIDEDDRICDDKHRLIKEFINAIIYNLTKPSNHFRYSDNIKDFALSLYILGGKLTYEFVRLNLPGSLPNLTMLHSLISNSNLKISEAEFRFDELQNKLKNLNIQYAFGSEDMTSVIKKIKYDSITNTFVGFPTPLAHGIPIKEYYKTDSFDILKLWFSSIEKSSLLNVHIIQPLQSSSQNVIPSPFLLAAYGTNTTTTADDILQRGCYIIQSIFTKKNKNNWFFYW
ncbi:unnamed protein product [Rotaria sp. Silwood2]|nr:unnamed protein product [Rotaria sp. Silwood2]